MILYDERGVWGCIVQESSCREAGLKSESGRCAPVPGSAPDRQALAPIHAWAALSEQEERRPATSDWTESSQAMPRKRRPRNAPYPMPPTTPHDPAMSAAQAARTQVRRQSMGSAGACVIGDMRFSSIATLFMGLI